MSNKAKLAVLSAFSLLFAICLLLSRKQSKAVFVWSANGTAAEDSITAEIQSGDCRAVINAFLADNGNYYLCLPSWTEGNSLVVERMGRAFHTGRIESSLTMEMDTGQRITLLTGSEIPSIFLTLENDLSYISSDKSLSDTGQALILDADGGCVYAGGLERIRGRGNSSWGKEKKPFNITLSEAVLMPGNSGKESEFALVASNDISFLRNRISGGMAEAMGAFHEEGCRVNLYVNNSFEGVYEIYRRITPESLGIWNLEEETELLNRYQGEVSQVTTGAVWDDWNQSITGKWWDFEKNPEDITGGYILEMDQAERYGDEASGFILGGGAYVVSKSPSRLSEEQYRYISDYVQECEGVLMAAAGQKGAEELSYYIDIPSFVAKYLVEEVSKNIDCSSTSQYFYKDREGVLYAGPVWDYDCAYGTDRFQEGIDYLDPEGFSARETPGTFKWWQLIYYNEAIYQEIVGVYEETLYPYLEQLTRRELALWGEEMEKSAVMDYIRWNRCQCQDLAQVGEAYCEQVQEVADFLAKRMEFLRREWVAE